MKSIKRNIAIILYRFVSFLVKNIPAKSEEKHLLIIKVDEIGDYILFRNYFKYFKAAGKYKGFKITMVANKAWKSLYETYDKDSVDSIIWLDKTRYMKDIKYRFAMLANIRKVGSSDVVNCIFSRSADLDDGIVATATGSAKIAMYSDETNRKKNEKDKDGSIYTNLIDAGDRKIFDTERNRNFIEKVLEIDGLTVDTKVSIPPQNELPTEDYLAIFIGAGNPERRWPIPFFIECVKYAAEKYKLVPVVCGGPGDETDAASFVARYGDTVLNYAGKTTLPQMMELLSKAKFLICVDTGALHMGVAAGCPVIGLFSGKFYGRFAPYPKEITEQFYAVYPDFVDELIAKKAPILYDTNIMKNDTMKMIPPSKVIPYIDKLMSGKI